ncbi:MAG: helix-turn-helix domain-containing protein [Oscillospiraceae bacterium]|nr:helix-turn-helix domain-containing protein [Oscillospiraceae bacterium]
MNISQSIEYIERNLTEALNVDVIAGNAFFSRRHYQLKFAAAVGENVMEYVRKRRLTLAAEDLICTGENIIEIALKYGYETPEGFSRAFKAFHGVTPSDCRKFGLFRSKKLFKELKPMAQLKITADFAEHFGEMSRTLRTLATLAITAERESGVPGNVFSGFSKMTNLLAATTENYAEKLREFCAKERNFGEYSATTTEMIKVSDDAAFTLQFINFNIGLNVARTQEQYRGKLQALADAYTAATVDCAVVQQKFYALVADFMQNAKADIQAELSDRETARYELLSELRRNAAAVSAFVKNAAEQSQIGAFSVIADEIAGLQIDDTDAALFKSQLLSMTAHAELARTPDSKQLIAAAEQISAFAKRLANEHGKIRALNAEIVKLCDLLAVLPPSVKLQEDSLCNTDIFKLYIKLEREKLSRLLTAEQSAELSAVESADALRKFAVTLGARGGALTYLADEWENHR